MRPVVQQVTLSAVAQISSPNPSANPISVNASAPVVDAVRLVAQVSEAAPQGTIALPTPTPVHNHDEDYDPLGAAAAAVGEHEERFDHESFVTGTPWLNEGFVTGTPWQNEGYVTGTPWQNEGYVTGTPWQNEGYVTGTPWQNEGYVTGTPWLNEGFVTGTPWRNEGYLTQLPAHSHDYEPELGAPEEGHDGYVLASTAAGVRSWVAMTGGAAGANQALSNLADVAINASLLGGADGTLDFGSALKRWKDGYFSGSLNIGGTTYLNIAYTAGTAGATSYANPMGSGNRSASIAVTTTGVTGSPATKWVDGIKLNSNNCWTNGGAASGVSWVFDFGAPQIIDEIKYFQQASTQGTYVAMGSHDNSSWVTLSAPTLVNAATNTFALTGNVTGFRYYKIVGVSGTSDAGYYAYEFEFKIVAAGHADATHSDSRGTMFLPSAYSTNFQASALSAGVFSAASYSANIVPSVTTVFNLGSPTYQWKDAYIGGNIYLPASSSTAGQLVVNGTVMFHTYGSLNFFMGPGAGNFTTTGSGQNMGIGRQVLRALTTGFNNWGAGDQVFYSLTTGQGNTAGGKAAAYYLTDAYYCTALGAISMGGAGVQHCLFSTCVGYASGFTGNGDGNTWISYYSGYGATGSFCVGIGPYSGRYETGSYKLFIDCVDRGDEATSRTSALMYGVMSATVANQELHVNAMVFMGTYTTVARPAYKKGGMIFDSDLGKYLIGGAATWEVITSV
jgi:hypothetical protein